MNIIWKTFDFEGRSFKEGLSGTFNGTTFATSYTDYPLFMVLAKFRIWIRFKIRTGSSPVLATNKFYKNYVDSTLLAPDVS